MPKQLVDTEILQAALVGLEHQKSEIDAKTAEIRRRLRALSASNSVSSRATGRKRVMSAAARKRIAAAQRKRWAVARQQKSETKKPKRVLSAEARRRIAASTRKRWAALRKATGGKLQRLAKMPMQASAAKPKTRKATPKAAAKKAAATA